jgi:RNA polymerase sigma-70 factor, ECF subfamily
MSDHELTRLLNQLADDSREQLQPLLPVIYKELKQRASQHMRRERADHTLNTTALVHESYLKLMARPEQQWQSRGHFFAVASVVMRHIIIDHARQHLANKRGGADRPVSLDLAGPMISPERAEELLELDEALEQLTRVNDRAARVVQCRYFAGLTHEETAEALRVSVITVRRDWALAAAWLKRRMGQSDRA